MEFQLTSPQGDELKELMKYTANTYISIHVSLRRRTRGRVQGTWTIKISTHISLRRRTAEEWAFTLFIKYFNSRLRKETNDADYAERGTLCDFNSRLLGETNMILHSPKFVKTISTHVSARKRTSCVMVICSWAVYFNSHPHKETNIRAWWQFWLIS